MNLKRSPFAIQDKNSRDLDNARDYSTLKELVEEQGISTDLSDYWDKECELNPSDPHCLVYDDQSIMKLKKSPFSIFDKDKKEIDFIKTVYKKKIQSEIESYKDTEDEDKIDTIQVQDVLILDIISI